MALLAVRGKGGTVAAYTEVDDVDYLWASQYKWHLASGYAARGQRRQGRMHRMMLAREILGLKHGYRDLVADHIDGDPLNNVRENLRAVSYSANAHNRKATNPGKRTSQHRGVHWYTARSCWRVAIMVNGVRSVVGYFDDETEAARAAYDFYAENAPFANVTAPRGPGAVGDQSADVQPFGPGRSAAIPEDTDP